MFLMKKLNMLRSRILYVWKEARERLYKQKIYTKNTLIHRAQKFYDFSRD